MSNFNRLPLEVLLKIYHFLDFRSVSQLRASSSFFSQLDAKECLSLTELEREITTILDLINSLPLKELIYFYNNFDLFDYLPLKIDEKEEISLIETNTKSIKHKLVVDCKESLGNGIEHQISLLSLEDFFRTFDDQIIDLVAEINWHDHLISKLKQAPDSWGTIKLIENLKKSNRSYSYLLNDPEMLSKLSLYYHELENKLNLNLDSEETSQLPFNQVNQFITYSRMRLICYIILLLVPICLFFVLAEPFASLTTSNLTREWSEPLQASLFAPPLIAFIMCFCSIALAVNKCEILTNADKALEDLEGGNLPTGILSSNCFFSSSYESNRNKQMSMEEELSISMV